jgi:hypothetical protein
MGEIMADRVGGIGDVAQINRGNRLPSFAPVCLPTVEAIYKNMPASYDNRRKEINRCPVAFDGGIIFSQARVKRLNEDNFVGRYRDR